MLSRHVTQCSSKISRSFLPLELNFTIPLICERRRRHPLSSRFVSTAPNTNNQQQQQKEKEEEVGEDLNKCSRGWRARRRLSDDLFNLSRHLSAENGFHHKTSTDQPQQHKARRHGSLQESVIPLQTKQTAELLFDYLAPHLDHRALKFLSARLAKFAYAYNVRSDANNHYEEEEDKGVVHQNDEEMPLCHAGKSTNKDHKKKKSSRIFNGATLVYQVDEFFKKDAPWIRPLIAQFLVGGDLISHISGAKKSVMHYRGQPKAGKETTRSERRNELSNDDTNVDLNCRNNHDREEILTAGHVWLDPTFPPNSNRLTWSKDVQILLRAREKASYNPPLLCSSVRVEPNCDVSTTSTFPAASSISTTFVDDEALEKNQQTAHMIHTTKSETTKLEEAEEMAAMLADRLPRSCHEKLMILLAKYAPESQTLLQSEQGEQGPDERCNSNGCEAPVSGGTEIKYLVSKLNHVLGFHLHLVALNLAKYLYVYVQPSIMEVSNATVTASMDHASDATSASNLKDNRLLHAWREWNNTRSDLVEALLNSQRAYALHPPSAPKRKTKMELLQEMIPELDILRTKMDGSMVGRDKVPAKSYGRSPKVAHCVFDALILREDLIEKLQEKHRPLENRVMFVNNLPIDITEDELGEIYGRCGGIESIELFNKRPDLDPGAPSRKELLARRKKSRRDFKRERSRTPVYARIVFRDEVGYNVANNSNLTIFGVVIRKHPCRSLTTNLMRSLFVENITPGQYSMDLEYKLSKALHPEIYVCLSVGDHDYSEPASCEIKFPSHEVASFAYERLRNFDLGSDDLVINWMRTPRDAHLQWTREIGYD